MTETDQMERTRRFYEDRATVLLERVLHRKRWSANDRDNIAKFLEKTAIKSRSLRPVAADQDDE